MADGSEVGLDSVPLSMEASATMTEIHKGADFADLSAPTDRVGIVPGPMTDQPGTQEGQDA